jgi:thymidylate synthase (FAD)
MRIVKPQSQILQMPNYSDSLRLVEFAGRTCYKSIAGEKDEDAETFIRGIIKKGHLSVIEHAGASVHFIMDRGITHEIVRHRLCSFSQESTRYCNYSKKKFDKEITVIESLFHTIQSNDSAEVIRAKKRRRKSWVKGMEAAESYYFEQLELGASAQEARGLLPVDLKAEIVVTCNFRQWREVFTQRISKFAHPKMRQLMCPLLEEFKDMQPVFFEGVEVPLEGLDN